MNDLYYPLIDSTYNVKLIGAQQIKGIHKYKNIKEKLYICNTAVGITKHAG